MVAGPETRSNRTAGSSGWTLDDAAGHAPNGHSKTTMPIAIVGMSCKFGGDASTPHKLWEMVSQGRSCWSPIPETRFDAAAWYHPDQERRGRNHATGGHFLTRDLGVFDAGFFNLATDIANCTDPQVRLVLESVYEAVENAGIPMQKLSGTNTGVFSGVYGRDYNEVLMRDPETAPKSLPVGVGAAMMSNRVSHFYDFKGASFSTDTGCSSSLVALHQAVSSLRNGESDTAIITASNVMLDPDMFVALSTQGVTGADGKVYAWDDRAQGYGRGEGVATILIKPLEAALKDGDSIRAVIRETGLNQDGRTATITSPSGPAQETLIRQCYERAGLNIADTPYVEAHMTGTAAGDKTEAETLGATFGKCRLQQGLGPVIVGGVKPNIGHTEAVSGLAAICKSIIMLEKELIPPNVNYEVPSTKIPLEDWNLKVPLELSQWPEGALKRISVNNFGYGGTNAHVILDQAPISKNHLQGGNGNANQESPGHQSHLFIVSAKDTIAATGMATKLADFIRESPSPISPVDLAYSLSERKELLPHVVAINSTNLTDLADKLTSPANKPIQVGETPSIGFVFNGQGAQWHAMGRELISSYRIFHDSIYKAEKILEDLGASWSLIEELMRDPESTRVGEMHISQPISVTLQICLVDLLSDWGIKPSAVTSHSSGEIAAAYAVGALSFKEAIGVAFYRGELALQFHSKNDLNGGMLAAGLGAKEAQKYLTGLAKGRVVVACHNSPESVTLSGDMDGIDEVEARLKEQGVFARKLKVPLAYHSHHMQHMAKAYEESLDVLLGTTETRIWSGIPFYSPVTGGLLPSPKSLGSSHWVENLVSPVLFSQSFDAMSSGVDFILEVGAHGTLAGPIRQIVKARSPAPAPLPYVSCLKRGTDAVQSMQELAAFAICHGAPLRVNAVNSIIGDPEPEFIQEIPTYAWNHTRRYWTESRLSRETRLSGGKPHQLLGKKAAGSNGLTPTWRQFLRLQDLPWLSDHQLEGNAILPGAGYVTMAIEAVRRITDLSEETILGYKLRDVDIINALNIPEDTTGLEVQICLRPCDEKQLDHKNWWEFELSSCGEGHNWTKHGRGYVCAETKETVLPHTNIDSFFGTETPKDVDPEEIFSGLRAMNFYHGPQFQNLLSVKSAEAKSVTKMRLAPLITEASDYVIHPTTLDSIVVAAYKVMDPAKTPNSTTVPRGIRSMYIAKNTARFGATQFESLSTLVKQSKRGFEANATILAQGASEPCIVIEGLLFQAIPKAIDSERSSDDPVMLFQNSWEVDITRSIPASIQLSMKIELSESDKELEKKLAKAAYFIISDTIAQLDASEADQWELHHRQFFHWMKSIVAAADANELALGSRVWSKTSKGLRRRALDEIASAGGPGALLSSLNGKLAEVVSGKALLTDLVQNGQVAKEFYQDGSAFKRSCEQLENVVQLYAAKNPGAKVLEIGGHKGSSSKAILSSSQNKKLPGMSLFSQYDFSDITSDFFEVAKKNLVRWDGILDFKVLDITSDPTGQSFNEASYDLIVSSLYETADISISLENIKKLLKPRGQLILVVPTKSHLSAQVALGALPGAWPENNDSSKPSVIFSQSEWEEALVTCGFSTPQLAIHDCEDASHQSLSLIMAVSAPTPSYPSRVSLVHAGTDLPQEWTSELRENILKLTGVEPAVESIFDIDVQDKVCIVAAEMFTPLIDGMNGEMFPKVQNLLLNARGVMWLTAGGVVDGQVPHLAQIQGIMRTLKQEDASVRRIQLDFGSGADRWSSNNVSFVTQVFAQSFDFSVEDAIIENEYAVKESKLLVPRVYHDLSRDRQTAKNQSDPEPVLKSWNQPDDVALIWERGTSGLLSQTYFVDHPTVPQVPDGYVEIEARAFGLNFRDVLLALGQLDETHLAHESCGVITRLGPNTEESELKVGDRVCSLVPIFGSKVITKWTSCARIPVEMTFEEGASIVFSYATGYLGLVDIAHLEKGERVLIHAATGAAGQAAVMLAQNIGAEVYVTCGTASKRAFLQQHYNIPDDHIFNSRDSSFGSDVMAATDGKGVDVVYNSLAGGLLKTGWECLSRFGRFVEIGKMDIEGARRLEMTPFTRMATFAGLDIIQVSEYKPRQFHNALTVCLDLFSQGRVKAVAPITTYPISQMESAMRLMQSGGHMGKIVLVPHAEDQVKVLSSPRPVEFEGESTYLIAGNVAGIGRSIATWMIERGAKNLVLLSRSIETHPDVPSLVQEAASKGCNLVTRNCDISSEVSVSQLAGYCSENLPPIGGVIVAAMVLDDTVMESLTYEQWHRGIMPKVAGSWNLHKQFQDLQFFVMFSSIVGVTGHASQAAYAAGNAFQDALAKHRTSLGLAAASLDLGAVSSIGYVAEAGDAVLNNVAKLGTTPIDMDHVLRIMEASIREPLKPASALEESQYITSISPFESISEDAVLKTDRRFGTLRSSSSGSADAGDSGENSSTILKKSLASGKLTKTDAAPLITAALIEKLADTFSLEVETINPALPMSKYGLDSLVAVELRNWLSGTIKAKVTLFEILQSPSMNEFGVFAASKSELLKSDE